MIRLSFLFRRKSKLEQAQKRYQSAWKACQDAKACGDTRDQHYAQARLYQATNGLLQAEAM
jgi:hypothetical protein